VFYEWGASVELSDREIDALFVVLEAVREKGSIRWGHRRGLKKLKVVLEDLRTRFHDIAQGVVIHRFRALEEKSRRHVDAIVEEAEMQYQGRTP
jgi:hypothetical protein